VLRGRDVHDIEELKRQGLSIRAISRLTGYCRKTVRKYLIQPDSVPVYGPREKHPGKLEAFKPYVEERTRTGVWNARVLLRELRERGYSGGYTLLTDWLRPQRVSAHTVAVRRFETCSWRIDRITRRLESGTSLDSASATGTTRDLLVT